MLVAAFCVLALHFSPIAIAAVGCTMRARGDVLCARGILCTQGIPRVLLRSVIIIVNVTVIAITAIMAVVVIPVVILVIITKLRQPAQHGVHHALLPRSRELVHLCAARERHLRHARYIARRSQNRGAARATRAWHAYTHAYTHEWHEWRAFHGPDGHG